MKEQKERRVQRICYLLLCILVTISLIISYCQGIPFFRTNESHELTIIGNFSVDGGEEQRISEHDQSMFEDAKVIEFVGHFNEDIDDRYMIFFRLENITIDFYINDTLVCTTNDETSPAFFLCVGRSGIFFQSPGITSEDEIRIVLSSPHLVRSERVFDKFIHALAYGHGEFAFLDALAKRCVPMGFCLVTIGIGCYSLIFFAMNRKYHLPGCDRNTAFSATVIIGGLWSYFSIMNPFAGFLSRSKTVAMQLDYASVFLLPVILGLSLYYMVRTKKVKLLTHISLIIARLLATVAFALQVIGVSELIDLQLMSAIASIGIYLSYLCFWLEVIRYRIKEQQRLALMTVPVVLGTLLQMINFYMGIWEFTEFFTVGYSVTALILVGILLRNMHKTGEQLRLASDLKNEVTQKRIELMVSQIQPHFLFNALNAIKQLCAENPQEAEEAVGHFARYMRLNLDTLSVGKPALFSVELECVQNYLYIEQIRVGDRLKIIYDIQDKDFLIPVLTVQPLAENAVRHGITKKPEGGTLVIHTERTAYEHIIIVSDDGIGYDVSAEKKDNKVHVGIGNVRERVKAMVNGTLTIESELGIGTRAMIRIPIEEKGLTDGTKDIFGSR